MDGKITAIMLRSTDQGDYDKRVCLLSAEEGRTFATLKGVRKPKAKLKFAAQPFALCEYEIVEKSGKKTVTGATAIEDLYALTLNPEKYAAAALCCEIADRAVDSIESATLFVLLLKTLKTLLFSEGLTQLIVAKYAQKLLSVSGFIRTQKTAVAEPKTPSAVLDYIAYKSLDETEQVRLDPKLATKALKLICARFSSVYEASLNSLSVYEQML